jgi:hypothetical protein
VCVDHSPGKIRERALKLDINLSRYEGLFLAYIDCVSGSLHERLNEHRSESTLSVTTLSNIEQIGMNIAKATTLLGSQASLFFYSISPLFLHNSSPVLLKFFQIISSQTTERGGQGVFVLHEGVHDDRTMDTLAMMAEGVVEMRFNEHLQREIRVHHIKGIPTRPDWNSFEIGGETLDIVLSDRIPQVKLLEAKPGIDKVP